MSITTFFHSQLMVKLPYPTTDFTGQIVIVTGANIGLGLEAARHFARLNAEKVILGVRTISKGEEAKASIEKSTGKKNVLEVWELDLAKYESVKKFAARACDLPRLDAVVENAGIATREYTVFEDNESTITVNVVSTMLLALLVLPKLRETATKYDVLPHLTIVSSAVHAFTKFPERKSKNIFETLNGKNTAVMSDRYNVSKLLEVFAVRELADQTRSSKPQVAINFLNPGLCHSGLSRNLKGFGAVRLSVLKSILARSTEVGSRTLVHAAKAGYESHGKYLDDCKVMDEHLGPLVRSPDGEKAQKQVWAELCEKLKAIQPNILNNITP